MDFAPPPRAVRQRRRRLLRDRPTIVLPPRNIDAIQSAKIKQLEKRLKQVTSGEMKVYTQNAAPATVLQSSALTGAGTELLRTEDKAEINILSQSASIGNRSGNKITLKSLQFRAKLTANTATDGNAIQYVRLLIIQFTKGDLANALLANALNKKATGGITLNNAMLFFHRGRMDDPSFEWQTDYRVLFDKFYAVSKPTVNDGVPNQIFIKETVNIPKKGIEITYNGKASSDYATNKIMAYLIHSTTTNLGTPSWEWIVKSRYME